MACKPEGAAAVQLVAGYLNGQAGFEGGQASDGGVFAGGVAVSEDDIVHLGRVHAAAFQGGLDGGGCQFGGGDIPEGAAEVADGGADGGNDGYSAHNGCSFGRLGALPGGTEATVLLGWFGWWSVAVGKVDSGLRRNDG